MLGLEPKDLPVGILINMESEGRYVKDRMFGVTVWLAEDIHCADCAEIVFDEPTPELILQASPGFYKVHEESSQEFFGMDWSIVSVPWHLAVALAKVVSEYTNRDWQNGISVEDTLKSAIQEYTKAEEETE